MDLDLFTLDDLALDEAGLLSEQLASDLGCTLGSVRRTAHFHQYLLEPGEGEPLQVDLVRDFGPQFGERLDVDGMSVDSVENIGANNLTAILGRSEPKDLVDLYFVLEAGCDFEDLLAKAKEKDLGMQPFYLAGSLLQAASIHLVPETYPPITPAELQDFATSLANRLLDQLRP